ncbi:MAG TPA: glycosyl hydrolase family 28-related protein, partial [Methyloceanibacter sp.]|nr:glycosyl hydrolase family 28-related protein [Methyloceanibacter sp.]
MRAVPRRLLLAYALLIVLAHLPPAEALAGSDTAKRCPEPAATSVTVNVKTKGAKGDGRANDTAAIQAAIDAVATGGTVLVPDGT